MRFPRFTMNKSHLVLAALTFGALAMTSFLYSRSQEEQFQEPQFRSMTPQAHYVRALSLLHIGGSFPEPSQSDLDDAILHLRADIADSHDDPKTQHLLDLLLVKRDRPKEFAAEEEASFLECMASYNASIKKLQEEVVRSVPAATAYERMGHAMLGSAVRVLTAGVHRLRATPDWVNSRIWPETCLSRSARS